MNAETVNRWMNESATAIAEQRDYLTQLDAAIGDADHGANMNRGFAAVEAEAGRARRRRPPGKLLVDGRQHPGLDRGWRQRAAVGHRSAARRQVAGRVARRSSPTPLADALRPRWTAWSSWVRRSPATRPWWMRLQPAVDALRRHRSPAALTSRRRSPPRPRPPRGHARDRPDARPQGAGAPIWVSARSDTRTRAPHRRRSSSPRSSARSAHAP